MTDATHTIQMSLQKIYLKDASLETPMGIEAFQKSWQPKINQQIQTRHKTLEENVHEVVLIVTVTTTLEEKSDGDNKDEASENKNGTAFIVEVQQAGVFQLSQTEAGAEKKFIHTACPTILFPYAREAIDSLIVKAGFPALNIPPINFDALYQQALEQQQDSSAPH